VTIQAQILDLMRELKRTSDAAIILITHDLGVVAEVCDEVAVMYAGEIVERAPADALFEAPEHPYTVGLLASIPRLDERADRLAAIDGVLPDMTAPPIGCRFADRCPFVLEDCRAAPPARGRSRRTLVALPARAAGATRHMSALVEAEGLVKRFVARRSIFGTATAHVNAVDRRQLHGRGGQDLGAGRRVRLGQVDGRADCAPPDRTDGGPRALCRRGRFCVERSRHARLPPPGAARVPGPVRLAQSRA
jgi:oligopeptide/dipeptide ABC transporter ATP-binding protein